LRVELLDRGVEAVAAPLAINGMVLDPSGGCYAAISLPYYQIMHGGTVTHVSASGSDLASIGSYRVGDCTTAAP
jgi:hypothetical protein